MKIKNILSTVEYSTINVDSNDKLIVEINKLMDTSSAILFIQSDTGITIDKFNSNLDHVFKGIRKIRVFDENKELYLWRKSVDEFSGRLRHDGEGDEAMYYDTSLLVFGDDKQIGRENSGREIELPVDNTGSVMTRNYLEYNEIDQIGIIDYRIIKFGVRN